jgi:hypothetical protein
MGQHHTKDKGDLGTAKAHADLVGHGFMVLFPATEHAEFDLVAYRSATFYRVQVKYRSAPGAKDLGELPVRVGRPERHAHEADRQVRGRRHVHLLP